MATPRVLGLLCTIMLISAAMSNQILDKVVDSIDKYVKFNLKNTDEVEMFTLYSLKVVEGTVQHLLSERDEVYLLPRLTGLQDDIARLRDLSLHEMDEEELGQRWRFINEPWLPPKSYSVIDENYKWTASQPGSSMTHEKLSEKLGKCMEDVVSRKRVVPSKQHRVEKKCVSRDYMLARHSKPNMHLQLMFFLHTQMYGFKEFVNGELLKMNMMGGIKEAQLELCTNAFYMTQEFIKDGQISPKEMMNYSQL